MQTITRNLNTNFQCWPAPIKMLAQYNHHFVLVPNKIDISRWIKRRKEKEAKKKTKLRDVV